MCGRYELQEISGLGARFRATSVAVDFTAPRYNVAPGQLMPVVVHKSGDGDLHNSLELMKWGLVPSWSKDPRTGFKAINARAETVTEKPSYRKPLQSKRCLVPVSGFYEWHETGSGKIPYHIYLKDEPVFALAGLYDTWLDPQGHPLDTYAIITTSANTFMERLHNRMPVILGQDIEEEWLDPTTPLTRLLDLLAPFEPAKMVADPVSSRVNNVRNDDLSLLATQA